MQGLTNKLFMENRTYIVFARKQRFIVNVTIADNSRCFVYYRKSGFWNRKKWMHMGSCIDSHFVPDMIRLTLGSGAVVR
jgi:hypothetical protein